MYYKTICGCNTKIKEVVPLTPIEPSKPSEKPQHNPFPSELDIEEINKYYKNMNELLDRILG